MMSLETKINEGIKEAMMAKETVRLTALRAVKAEILLARTAGASVEVNDDTVLKIIRKLVKQRRESAQVYQENGRPELAANELGEARFLEGYLPVQLTAQELQAALKEIIAKTGASGLGDIGRVMGAATKELAGRADGRAIADAVKALLQ